MNVMAGFQLFNLILLLAGLGVFVLFVIVLFKLNKALNIWLEQNRRN